MNSLFVIAPYRYLGMWVFDDEARGLLQEPFVAGADTWLDRVVPAGKSVRLVYSDSPFPGKVLTLRWLRSEHGGNVYRCDELASEGWLCPALLRYFDTAPADIHIRVDILS